MSDANTIRVKDLVVEHLTRSGRVRTLNIPELEIAGGTSIAIMGPSGCGKSTLLGVLAGLELPTAGSVTIGTTQISTQSETKRVAFRKSMIGILYQSDNLLPFLTIFENIQLQLALRDDTDDVEKRIDRLLDHLRLNNLGSRLPDQLSGGQRQRAALARSIIHQPTVILADEPTGALDDETAATVIDLLLDVHQRLDSTLVVVTHDPLIASKMARVVMLRDGAIISG